MKIKQLAWRLGGIIVAITACLFGSVTYAMFTDDAPLRGVIIAGDLDVTLGVLTWSSPTLGTSGTGVASLAAASLGDRDQLVIDQPIGTTFTGDNLDVAITVDWDGLPPDAAAAWFITDANQHQVVPDAGTAALGEEVPSFALVSASPQTWHVIITVTMPGGVSLYVDPASQATVQPLSLGTITITANQVRG
ncbi:MAG: hypothetical protein FWF36_04450 [Propionibacteriaceae bacterium]|nr:hypothetical protein [Propionibacteriaceae bacterium]